MTHTLEERIEEFKTLYTDLPKAKDALEIITELQEQNKAWQGMVESTCQTNKALCDRLKEGADAFYSQEKKLDEALAKNGELEESAKMAEILLQRNHKRITQFKASTDDLKAKVKELEGKVEIAKKGLEALSSCDAGQAEWISILNQCYDQLIYNKQGEKHDK